MPNENPQVVEAHSEAYDKAVQAVRDRLSAVEKELNAVNRKLYGNNIAVMSDGKRGRRLPPKVFKATQAAKGRLDKQVRDLRKELRHLGAE